MHKKTLICCILFSNLTAMDEPIDWVKRVAAKLSPRKSSPEDSSRTPHLNEKVSLNPLIKEQNLQNPNISIQDCHALANLALEIDQLYRNGKEIILKERVETAYIKALKCFVTTFEQDKYNATLYLTKLHLLFLQLESEKKQTNPSYSMSEQISVLNKKVYDFIKSYVNESNHE